MAVGTQAVISGSTGFVARFTSPTDLGSSLLFDNGTNVGLGTTTPTALLHVEETTGTGQNALNAIVTVNNSSPISGVVSALNMNLIDNSTATNLSKQSARMVYIRGAGRKRNMRAVSAV